MLLLLLVFLKTEIAKISRGSTPGPRWGAQTAPQTPRSDTMLLRNVVLGRYATYLLNVNISRIFLLRILTPYPPMFNAQCPEL